MINSKKINLFLDKWGHYLVIGGAAFYVIIFGFVSLWKYYNFGYNGLDLAIINQVFYNSSLGQWFASSIHPPSYLGDHFSPILFLLLPIYMLFRQPLTLLILQTAILALSSWPIYLISRKALNKNWAILLALAWLFNPYVQNINLFEFHFLGLAVFFIIFAFYFYQEQKFFVFWLFCFLALLVREDVSLVVFMFGPIALLDKRKVKWWLAPMVLSLIYFILAVKVSDLFSTTGQYKFLLYYSWLGNGWLAIMQNVILHPWILLPKIFSFGSLAIFFALLLPVAGLPLLKPKYLLLAAPIYLQLVIGVGWNQLGMILFTQYSSLFLPGIFLAVIFGLKKITEPSQKSILYFLTKEKPLLVLLGLSAMVYGFAILGPLPQSLLNIAKQGLILPQTATKTRLMAAIPADAAVAASYDFLTPLSSRANIASLNYAFLGKQQFLYTDYQLPEKTQYLAVNFDDLIAYHLMYGLRLPYQDQYQKALINWPKIFNGFGLTLINDSLALYQKGAPDNFTLVQILDQLPRISSQNITLDPSLEFLGFNQAANQYQLFWRASLPPSKIYWLKLVVADGQKIIYQKIYPLAYGFLADQTTADKKIIQTNYWFEFPKNMADGTYQLKLNVLEITGGGVEIDSFRGTKNTIDSENLIGPEISLGQITL